MNSGTLDTLGVGYDVVLHALSNGMRLDIWFIRVRMLWVGGGKKNIFSECRCDGIAPQERKIIDIVLCRREFRDP